MLSPKKAAPSKKTASAKTAPRKPSTKSSAAAKPAKAPSAEPPRTVDETYTDPSYGDAVARIAARRRNKPSKVKTASLEGYRETPSNGEPAAEASAPAPKPKKPTPPQVSSRTIELEAVDIFEDDPDDDRQA